MKDRKNPKQNNNGNGLEISAQAHYEGKDIAPFESESEEGAEIFINEVYLNISKRLRVLRFLLLFAIIIISLFALMRFSSHINLYSIKEFFYSFKDNDISLDSASVTISGADLIEADIYRNHLLMLRNDRVELYKPDGTRYMTKRISMSNPTVISSDKYFLIYDLGGYDLGLYNTVDVIYEESFDNTIYIADTNNKGYLALLTHDVSYASQLLVYNEDMNNIFEWNSADKYTPCMKMLSDTEQVITASFSSSTGIPVTTFNLFNVKSENALTHEFSDTLPLKVGEIGNGMYLLCTDRLVIFDKKGEIIKEIDTTSYGDSVSDVYCDGERLVLVLQANGYSYASKLILFDENAELLFTCNEKYEIPSAAVINNELYYIHYGELINVDLKDKTEKRTELTDSYSDILQIGGKLVLVSETETLIFG